MFGLFSKYKERKVNNYKSWDISSQKNEVILKKKNIKTNIKERKMDRNVASHDTHVPYSSYAFQEQTYTPTSSYSDTYSDTYSGSGGSFGGGGSSSSWSDSSSCSSDYSSSYSSSDSGSCSSGGD